MRGVQIVKKPFINKEQLEKIADQYATPFYLYDEKGIREMPAKLCKHLPGIKVSKNISPLKQHQIHVCCKFFVKKAAALIALLIPNF